ncbi:sortase-associated OmpA-like protein PdsO [Colwellia sp. 1_MG-2023]|uniref:sortase-associated OmpA-like protein PdsO n=1 Tax=Colwellia sp. 1_MG-2023 TaxID=3062649 RepID=UPI0026E46180|nr:sortase-associated OmpA-like protein PdsO [Colwellia sp. 1_MG-2023]MDO6447287.1 sortase-associated OmpA-like protein PdsO [Colwellia sp. 1_MG-2023]
MKNATFNQTTKNHGLKKTLLACCIATSLVTAPTMANDALKTDDINKAQQHKKYENIGFGSGLVLGAVVAGPVGAFVSGIIGVFTAKHINVSNDKDELVVKLSQEQNNHQLALAKYQQKMKQIEQEYQDELLALQNSQHNTTQLQAENLLMSLQFSTGSSDIQPHYQDQIDSLVTLLKQAPELMIDLSGYTDLQGNEELNHALSIARVNAVKHALLDKGITAERINLFAFGEESPVVANNQQEVSFYDRRVVIKLKAKPGLTDDTLNQQQTVSNY